MGFGVAKSTRRRLTAFAALALGITVVASGCSTPEPEVVVTVTQQAAATPDAGTAGQVTVPPAGSAATGEVTLPGTTAGPAPESVASAAPKKVTIKSTPESGSKNLAPSTPVSISAFNAKITDMKLVSKTDGAELTGEIAKDGASWALTDKMEYGTTYTYAGTSLSVDGVEAPIEGTLKTVDPKETMRASFQIPDGTTVGVAAPIVLTFEGSIENKAEVEAALKVTVEGKKVEGSWGWLLDEDVCGCGKPQSRIHYRTKDYWPANTAVTVEANLYGIDLGNDEWGREDLSTSFQIGRSLIIKADASSFRLVLVQDDEIVKNFPVSYGSLADPERATREGTHIVQEKFETFDMCNPRFGYCGVEAPWAVRISNNGEFIHVNENTEKAGQLGVANVSHGCINMGLADGKTFYDMTLYGDPVEVTKTGGPKLGASDGDIYDWAVPYEEWKTYSYL